MKRDMYIKETITVNSNDLLNSEFDKKTQMLIEDNKRANRNLIGSVNSNKIDTLTLHSIFKGADINFGKSNTKSIPCKTYRVVGKVYEMDVENCDRIATIKTLIIR